MKRLDITIETCGECPYCRPSVFDVLITGLRCDHPDSPPVVKDAVRSTTIPQWCPLPDVESEGNDESDTGAQSFSADDRH